MPQVHRYATYDKDKIDELSEELNNHVSQLKTIQVAIHKNLTHKVLRGNNNQLVGTIQFHQPDQGDDIYAQGI